MIPIAKEAQLPLLIMGALIALVHYKFGVTTAWLAWLLLITLLFLFRDFKRVIPAIPVAVISPIDARVIEIREIYDPYLNRDAKSVRLRQSVFGELNVHSPVEGKVQNLWVNSPTTPAYPQLAIWVQTDERDNIVMAADLNSVLRHASCRISVGQKLGQGQRCGLMAFACEVEVYLPATAHITIRVGQSVRAGGDKLAEFVRQTTV